MRKYYLDNIRWLTVLLVLVYHVFYQFNSVGALGGVGGFAPVQYQDAVLYLVYPWFMVLLFLVSGMSTRYALCTKTERQFLKSRTQKLLVPSTLGLVVFQWIVGYLNIQAGGGWAYIPDPLKYPVMVLSGTGPLWFIQLLWLFSVLLLLLRRLDKKSVLEALGSKCSLPAVLGMFLPIWGASQLFNAPVVTTYRFGIYFLVFLLGYYVFSNDKVMEQVEKIHIPALCAAVVAGFFYTRTFFGTDYTADACLKHPFTSVYLWLAVLAVLGCGKAWLNRTSRFASYMAKTSFGIYVVHYSVVISVCYLLKNYTSLPAFAQYALAITATLVLSPILYELLRRVPFVRYCVLGIKKTPRKKEKTQANRLVNP